MAIVHILVAVGLLAGVAEGAAGDCTVPLVHGASLTAATTCGNGVRTISHTSPSNTCTPACANGYDQTPAVPTMTCTSNGASPAVGSLSPPTFTCDPMPCTVPNSNMAPGPDCYCNNGFTANNNGLTDQSIVWSGTTTSTTCVAASCQVANSNMQPGPACACNTGYVSDTTTQSQQISWNGVSTASTCTPVTTTTTTTRAPMTSPPTTTPAPSSGPSLLLEILAGLAVAAVGLVVGFLLMGIAVPALKTRAVKPQESDLLVQDPDSE